MNGYHFTTHVREVLQAVRDEAFRLQHEYVGTEHLLLGLLQRQDSTGARILADLHLPSNDLRASVEALCKRGSAEGPRNRDLPYTSRAKKVLQEAMIEAEELGHSYIGTEHLLLGLFREGKGVAVQVLTGAGITVADARTKALTILETDIHAPRVWQDWSDRVTVVSPRDASGRFALRISILALVVAIIALAIALR